MKAAPVYAAIPPLPSALSLTGARALVNEQRLISLILVASVGYQAVLCWINTHVMPASRAMVGLAEALILLCCVPFLMRRLLPGVVMLACVAAATLCVLGLVNEQLNIKAFRDVAIPLCYFWLGCNLGKPAVADRALTLAITVVLVVGMFELLFVDTFTEVLDIFSYYVNIGSLTPITEYVRESRLQLNGIRPEGIGRTLLPGILSPHRVSSVFLEPISLGNFASICAAWGLCRERREWRKGAFFVGAAIFLMVLSDSRFALMTVSLFILIRFFLQGALINLLALAPFATVALLVVIGALTPNETGLLEDNFRGRLTYSGWSLMEFNLPMLLATHITDSYPDEGYAHMLSTFGLPLCLLFWACFWLLPVRDDASRRFRALVSVYIALILCISGTSFFALKSAGVLWFLVGCSLRSPAPALSSASPSLFSQQRSTHG